MFDIKIIFTIGVIAGAIALIVAVLFGLGYLFNVTDSLFGLHTGLGNLYIGLGVLVIIIVIVLLVIVVLRR